MKRQFKKIYFPITENFTFEWDLQLIPHSSSRRHAGTLSALGKWGLVDNQAFYQSFRFPLCFSYRGKEFERVCFLSLVIKADKEGSSQASLDWLVWACIVWKSSSCLSWEWYAQSRHTEAPQMSLWVFWGLVNIKPLV